MMDATSPPTCSAALCTVSAVAHMQDRAIWHCHGYRRLGHTIHLMSLCIPNTTQHSRYRRAEIKNHWWQGLRTQGERCNAENCKTRSRQNVAASMVSMQCAQIKLPMPLALQPQNQFIFTLRRPLRHLFVAKRRPL